MTLPQNHAPGTHLLIDAYGLDDLTQTDRLESAMAAAAGSAGATVLKSVFHGFPDRGGVTGVLILAESHISVHTWPELDYAAFDIFVCGAVDVDLAAETLRTALSPKEWRITRVARGTKEDG